MSALDIALDYGCFLCGMKLLPSSDVVHFSLESKIAPELPAHRLCVLAHPVDQVAACYHRAVGDLVDVPRASLGAVGRA